MLSENSKRWTVEDESSKVHSRCGKTRSSDEQAVMAMERRGFVIYTSKIKQPEMGGFYGGRKVVSDLQTSSPQGVQASKS